MRTSIRLALALSIAALTLGMAPGQAAATQGTYRPDVRISKKCSNIPDWQSCNPQLAGDNLYNATARKQKRKHVDYLTYSTEPDPRVVVFRISIQNDGSLADRFRVDADGTTLGYVVKFVRKSTIITTAVEAGTYTTPQLAPGASLVIKAKVVMKCPPFDSCGRDRAFDIAERLVTVRSVGDPTKRDAVKFVRQPWECTC
jgi:hypothetical protein